MQDHLALLFLNAQNSKKTNELSFLESLLGLKSGLGFVGEGEWEFESLHENWRDDFWD